MRAMASMRRMRSRDTCKKLYHSLLTPLTPSPLHTVPGPSARVSLNLQMARYIAMSAWARADWLELDVEEKRLDACEEDIFVSVSEEDWEAYEAWLKQRKARREEKVAPYTPSAPAYSPGGDPELGKYQPGLQNAVQPVNTPERKPEYKPERKMLKLENVACN